MKETNAKILAFVILVVIQCESFIITSQTRQLKVTSTTFVRYSSTAKAGRNLCHRSAKSKTLLNDATVYNDVANADDGSPSSENQQKILEQSDAPSVKTIVNFALPAIGIYLCSPLLSMIDTSTVGLICGTLQQAALNPAVTITDYSARTMSFLYTGTTNSIATSKDKKTPDQVTEMFLGSLRLAALVGGGLAMFLLLSSQRMIVPLVGNANIDVEVLRSAWRYVAIRALGMPAAAMIGTSQAACLGLQDNQTPFRIIVAAAVLNLVLDVAFVGRKMAWIGGTAGAAWATTISQYFALYLFFRRFGDREVEPTKHERGDEARDSPNRTPLELALELDSKGEEEILSLRRWDNVAGGLADFAKCVELLESALKEDGYSVVHDGKGSSYDKATPIELTPYCECGDEDEDKCKTSAWEKSFAAAILKSTESMMTSGTRGKRNTRENQTEKETTQDNDLESSSLTCKKNVTAADIDTNAQTLSEPNGHPCALCKHESLALFRSAKGNLVCRKCLRRSKYRR
jgi:hypothetical protein